MSGGLEKFEKFVSVGDVYVASASTEMDAKSVCESDNNDGIQ